MARTKLTPLQAYNPVKFQVYRNAAFSTTAGNFVKMPFDTRDFDTSSNVDITTNVGRFTAPVAGFYYFYFNIGTPVSGSGSDNVSAFYKNGSVYQWGTETSASGGTPGWGFMQLAATDYVEVFVVTNNAIPVNVGGSPRKTYFGGFLVSTT